MDIRSPLNQSWLQTMAAILIALLWPAHDSAAAPAVSAYTVSVGDVLMVWVYGDSGLTGLFPVGADGTIGYPILGNVDVLNKTTGVISEEIGGALADYVPNLSVAVTVKEYAPIFIVGEIQRPGKYEYRPGMIVLEAFALGGGLREASSRSDTSGAQLIVAQQEHEDLSLQLLAQDVKRARLQAEIDGTVFAYDGGNAVLARDPAVLQQIVDSEMSVFKLRLSTYQADLANLDIQRENYIAEIGTLTTTGAMRHEQFDLLTLDVDASQALVAKGAASQSALRERKRELLAMNQQLLEFGSFLARAQQNKNEIDRRIQALGNERRNVAATEHRDISLDMLRIRRKMAFGAQLMAEISLAAKRVGALESTVRTEFSVVRLVDGEYREMVINEHTPIQAGDVIKVSLIPSGHLARTSISQRQVD